MGDITSARPVSGQPVATAWGTEVHDLIEGIQAGQVSVTASAGNGNATVTFPRAYASAPVVVVSMGGSSFFVAQAAAITPTTFLAYVKDVRDAATGSGAQLVNWIAIGKPA